MSAAPNLVPIPYWVLIGGDAFEAAWATDRRSELDVILTDIYRTAWLAGFAEGESNQPSAGPVA
jgi:hypothetical protein